MARKAEEQKNNKGVKKEAHPQNHRAFHLEFLNSAQKMAWSAFEQHEVLFLLGPAGSGKSHLATAFAISELLSKKKRRIILTRPIVESGESLGFLPGTFDEKVNPYMLPLYDCIGKLVGWEGPEREKVDRALEVAPLAYMRGRSLSNAEIIPTAKGFVKMGDIKKGDYVFGSNGQPTKVLNVYPQGVLPVFEIKFSDHTASICSADHLWNTMNLNEKRHNKGYTTKSTMQIMECVKDKYNRKFHRIPVMTGAVCFENNSVPISPYLLGVLLGDGHFGKTLSITSADAEIVDECLSLLPPEHYFAYKGRYDYRIQSNGKKNKIKEYLIELGLWGKKSPKKFIPEIYKFNSVECRLNLLRGLMDTDGWICNHRSGNCRTQFCSTSRQLADDLIWLVRSMGGFAYSRLREFDESDSHVYNGKIIRHVNSSWTVDLSLPVNPFSLSRKAVKYKQGRPTKMISSIMPVGDAECTCIKVDSDDGLFLTNDFIITHNTFDDAVCIFDEAQNASFMQLKLFLTRFGENSKIIVTGDPTQSDLRGEVALSGVVEKLKTEPGIGVIEFSNANIVRHPLVGRILERLG